MGKDYVTSLFMAYYDETKHIKIVTIEMIGVKLLTHIHLKRVGTN